MDDKASTSLKESEGLNDKYTVYRLHKYQRRADGILGSGTAYSRYLPVTYLLHAMWHIRPRHYPSTLSAAAICTSLRFFHPDFSLFLSAVLLHVVLCLPRFRRPSGAQVNAVLQSLCSSFLMMWPMNFHLLLRTSSLRFSISAIFRTSSFVILSCQRILNICRRCIGRHRFCFHHIDSSSTSHSHTSRLALLVSYKA